MEIEKKTDQPIGENENPMGTHPILPLIIKMSVPSMFSMLVQAMYNIVDSIFVSMISQEALAAVSLVFPIQNIIIGVGVGTGVGLNSLVSRKLGEKNQKSADSAAAHGVVLSVFTWLMTVLMALLFVKPFFNAYSDAPELTAHATQYAQIVLYFSFGVYGSITIEKILQATGNMVDPMKIMLVGTVINIILDPIMIFGLLGMPAMGVAGAALATVIGQISAMSYAFWIAFSPKRTHRVRIELRGFRINWRIVKDIYRVGVPSMVMQCIGSIMVAGMNMILIGFSQAAVSAFGIYFKLQSFIFMPVFGLTSGIMPIMGYSYGARKRKRLMSCLWNGMSIAAVIMVIGTLVFMIFPEQLLGIFNADEELLRIGVPALKIISLSFIPAACGITVSTLFQAVGLGFNSLLMSLLRQLIVILPTAYWLSSFGVNYVWFAMPIAEVFSFSIAVLMFLRMRKTHIQPLDNPV